MTFEEEFPSLKEWHLLDDVLIDVHSGVCTLSNTDDKLFTQSSVMKHTIDKQRVKDAIDNNSYIEGFDVSKFKNELGLEDE